MQSLKRSANVQQFSTVSSFTARQLGGLAQRGGRPFSAGVARSWRPEVQPAARPEVGAENQGRGSVADYCIGRDPRRGSGP